MKRLTIYDIKRLSAETAPYYFTRNTLRFFGQTLRDFSVYKMDGGKTWKIVAEMRDYRGKLMGHSVRYFDTESRRLLTESDYLGGNA
jgi:hypothetical protein